MQAGRHSVECPDSFVNVSVPLLLYGIHSSTDVQIIKDIQQGEQKFKEIQQKGKQHMQIDLHMLIESSRHKSELIARNFMRHWNLEMRKMEVECPNTFYLIPASTTPFNPKNWISNHYKLFLMCQHPAGPHYISGSKGYDLRQAKDWWVKASPWLNHLITFLSFGVPITGKISHAALNEEIHKQVDKQVELLKKITEDIPNVVEHDATNLAEEYRFGDFEQNVRLALRELHSFLQAADPHQYWDGLQKVVTEDGNIFWLCEEHARPYQVRPLQL